MHIKKYILLLASVLFVVACSNDDFTHQEPIQDGPVKVGFWMGKGDSENTRTFINDDGRTISWEAEDKVALWAQKDNVYTFQNKTFDTWFVAAETNQAFFTTTLPEAMSEGTYTYYACYPLPQSVSGTTATFTLPSMQDGKMGGGADIMVAQGTGPALKKLYIPEDEAIDGQEPDYVLDQNRLSLKMHHLVHALRFYVPQAKWGFPTGETVERIVFTMPQTIAGEVETNVATADGSLALKNGGSKTITLSLAENMVASTSDQSGVVYDYAVGAIMPPSTLYVDSDKLVVKTYSQTRVATQEISLSGRGPQAADEKMRMAAGSVTPVGLDCSNPSERPKIAFRINTNNLGEQPYRITLTSADTNTKWKAGDDHVYEYYTGSESKTINKGEGFDIYYDFESIATISQQSVTVTYESKSAIVSKTITMPEMVNGDSYVVYLEVPYLFAENFDGKTLNEDNWKKSSGDSAWFPDYLKGWSGNQWRTDGSNLGIFSYTGNYTNASIFSSYTDFNYGRVDSPILPLKDVENIKLNIEFDVSLSDDTNNGSTGLIYGYSNNNDSISGGYTGAKTSESAVLSIRNLPTQQIGSEITSNGHISQLFEVFDTTNLRITWFSDINHKGSGSITTGSFYVYLDNITVKIVQ